MSLIKINTNLHDTFKESKSMQTFIMNQYAMLNEGRKTVSNSSTRQQGLGSDEGLWTCNAHSLAPALAR
jgi:hypothetical protein